MNTSLSTYQAAEMLMSDENANWSRSGAFALCEYLEELEAELDQMIELDVVALRCEYSQYESLEDWIAEYYGFDLETSLGHAGIDLDGEEGEEEISDLIRSHIQDHGQLIEFSDGVIVSSF